MPTAVAKPPLTSTIRRKAQAPQEDAVAGTPFKQHARSLDRLRIALRFSLWTWALYWPGGGLLLLYGGLDPIGLAVTLLSLASFLTLFLTGALKADASRTMKEFFVERPLYLVAGLVVLAVAAALVPSVEGFGLLLFSAAWFGGLGLVVVRLLEHVRLEGQGFWRSKADQMLVVLGMAAFFSALVFLDALLPIVADGATLGSPAALVAVGTWANLLYPGFILVASKPFREPLTWPSRQERAKAAKARRSKTPAPFRAS